MRKLLAILAHSLPSSIAIGFSLFMPLAALADSYDTFLKTQIAEFESASPENCREKRLETTESSFKMTYDLCLVRGKPAYLRTSADYAPVGVSIFKNGKLVQISLWEGTGGVGFRNGQPVVEWNSGEFSKRRVNWKLTAEEKSRFLEVAAREKRILRKFGY
jgi:hypothetical protein